MPIELTNEERETHLNMTADDRGVWIVYSDDPVMIARLERIGAKLTENAPDGIGRHYALSTDQVLLRKGKRQLSDATRGGMAARLAEHRAASRST